MSTLADKLIAALAREPICPECGHKKGAHKGEGVAVCHASTPANPRFCGCTNAKMQPRRRVEP